MGYTLEDIKNEIIEKINSPEGRFTRDIGTNVALLKNPALGLVGVGVNSFLEQFDSFKANRLLFGLSRGIDQERQINELYNYVVSSSRRAFIVGNIFRQNINADTPTACVLYGYIISDHTGENQRDFTQDELIVCNALVTATDYDIKNFKILMEKCVSDTEEGERKIAYPKDSKDIINMIDALNTTCSWCVFNRIFTSNQLEWPSVENEMLKIDTSYYIDKPADVLLKYIIAVQQILEYGD